MRIASSVPVATERLVSETALPSEPISVLREGK